MWNKNLKQKFETTNLKQQIWNKNLKQKFETKIWNKNLKRKFATTFSTKNFKHKFQIKISTKKCQTKIWNNKLKHIFLVASMGRRWYCPNSSYKNDGCNNCRFVSQWRSRSKGTYVWSWATARPPSTGKNLWYFFMKFFSWKIIFY